VVGLCHFIPYNTTQLLFYVILAHNDTFLVLVYATLTHSNKVLCHYNTVLVLFYGKLTHYNTILRLYCATLPTITQFWDCSVPP